MVSIASSVGNEQLAGGITKDKLTDRYTLAFDTLCLIPPITGGDTAVTGATQIDFGGASAETYMMGWQPTIPSGTEAYLCSIQVQAKSIASTAKVAFRLNGDNTAGSLIGGIPITIDTAATFFTLAQTDPVADPLLAMSNGDYINIYVVDDGTGNSTARGLYVTFGMKYILQS